jgi:hypothetical protein
VICRARFSTGNALLIQRITGNRPAQMRMRINEPRQHEAIGGKVAALVDSG